MQSSSKSSEATMITFVTPLQPALLLLPLPILCARPSPINRFFSSALFRNLASAKDEANI